MTYLENTHRRQTDVAPEPPDQPINEVTHTHTHTHQPSKVPRCQGTKVPTIQQQQQHGHEGHNQDNDDDEDDKDNNDTDRPIYIVPLSVFGIDSVGSSGRQQPACPGVPITTQFRERETASWTTERP